MNIILKGTLLVSLISLVSCASYKPYGTVLPQADGSYKLVNTGRTESKAMRLAQEDAKGTCKTDKKKRYVVLSQDADYIGVKVDHGDKKGLAGVGMSLLQAAADHENKENYQVTTVIQCK